MRRAAAVLLALVLSACVHVTQEPPPEPPPACRFSAADRAWLHGALDAWQVSARRDLRIDPGPLPTIVAIDRFCSYVLPRGERAGDPAGVIGTPHGRTVTMPDGLKRPLGPIAFASSDGGYFAIALPSLWRITPVRSDLGLERFLEGVLLHEIMHTSQLDLATGELRRIRAAYRVSSRGWDDDLLQTQLGQNAEYTAAWARERDALFAAAAAPDMQEARRLAREALAMMKERRARWLSGDKAWLAEADDVYLTMEGMGQWLAYRHFLSPEGGAFTPAQALAGVRRGGKFWSQDEGLALILVIDRLLPDWQKRAFTAPGWRAESMLAAAAADKS